MKIPEKRAQQKWNFDKNVKHVNITLCVNETNNNDDNNNDDNNNKKISKMKTIL